MSQGGVDCLLGEIALQRLSWMTLAPVPHDRRQERQVRRRQRAPIHRRAGEGGFRAAVRVVDVRDLEVRTRFDRNRNADQPFVEEQAVRGQSGFDARHVRAGTVGAVNCSEDRVGPIGRVEPRLDLRRRDGPCLRGDVAGIAGPAVRPEALEEGIGEVDRTRVA